MRAWQQEALDAWVGANGRGVIEAATGAGKTTLALAAVAHAAGTNSGCRLVIVVPSSALQEQWRDALTSQLGIAIERIALMGGSAGKHELTDASVLIAVIDSARRRLPAMVDKLGPNVFLVVDECHRAGSAENRKALIPSRWALGLSATPARADGEELHIYSHLGQPCFRYGLKQAMDDQVLAELTVIDLYIDLTDQEQRHYDDISRKCQALWRDLDALHKPLDQAKVRRLSQAGDPIAAQFELLVIQRAQLVKSASNRAVLMGAVAEWMRGRPELQTIAFHETVAAAEESHAQLERRGVSSVIEHSNLSRIDRSTARRQFADGDARVLVAVHASDEGVDYPDASCAFIVAGSRSSLQRVQRLGRVLRAGDGDKAALAISLLVRGTPEEWTVGHNDQALVGPQRVRHHRWTSAADIVDLLKVTEPSSYHPASSRLDVVEQLTAKELGVHEHGTQDDYHRPLRSKNEWIDVAVAAIQLSRPVAWVEHELRTVRPQFKSQTGPPPYETSIHSFEIEALERIQVPTVHAAPAPPLPKPKTLDRELTPELVLAAAAQVGPDRERIARRIGVVRKDLEHFLRAHPVVATKIKMGVAA